VNNAELKDRHDLFRCCARLEGILDVAARVAFLSRAGTMVIVIGRSLATKAFDMLDKPTDAIELRSSRLNERSKDRNTSLLDQLSVASPQLFGGPFHQSRFGPLIEATPYVPFMRCPYDSLLP
jgi:hypothetical protein